MKRKGQMGGRRARERQESDGKKTIAAERGWVMVYRLNIRKTERKRGETAISAMHRDVSP